MEQHDGNLDGVMVYKDCHTLKNKDKKGQWITKAAEDIIVSLYIKMHFNLELDVNIYNIYRLFANFKHIYLHIRNLCVLVILV